MDTGVIVDLSDNVELENARKKMDRKRFNEIRKYIPFLQYITAKDPVKNEKYVMLLQWFNSNKNLPARIATTCEFAIKQRFKALQSSMVFPPHIISIFKGGGDAIDLVSDDDDDKPITSTSTSTTEKQSNKNITEKSSKSVEVRQKKNTIVEKQTNFKNVTDTQTKVNDPKPSTSSTQEPQNDSITSVITIEDGELLSDCENVVKDDQKRKKTHSISLSEISLIEPPTNQNKSSVMPEDHDDILNQDLFDRIDNLDSDSVNPIVTPELSWKELEKEDSTQRKGSPILKPKNLESVSRKSPKNLSNSSDEGETLNGQLVHRKKKKKHKQKKKTQIQVKDSYDKSETENHQSEKQRQQDENRNDSSHKQKNTCKKKKEKLKITRPLYVSDDEEDQSNLMDKAVVESVKKPDSELFKRREFSIKETIPTENSSSDSITVVLLDSDEDEINTSPDNLVKKNNEVKPSPILEPQSSRNETTVSYSNAIVEEKTTNLLDTHKFESSSPSKLKDLNNMGLNELNDIYAKLCEKTGIQLEELLGDLVNKSAIPAEDNSVTIIEDTPVYSRHTNNFNNNDMNKDCYDSYNVQEKQFQQHQLQQQQNLHQQHMRQQSIHYQQQQEHLQFESHHQQQQQHAQQHQHQQQQQQQQQEFQNNMHCASNQIQNNSQVSYPYQNSLMPRLNLNDPRIVQKLKQIKDSPIHNLSIRESATLLMNCYTERPTYRSLAPVVKVTSNTATTYGEHKRLKEMEKLELERKAKQSKETEKTQSPTVLEQNSSEAGATSPKINTNKKLRKDSSGSENSQKQGKAIQNKTVTPNNSPSYSGASNQSKNKENAKRTNSSDFDSGRKTPKSRTDTEEDEETVVMSFTGRPKSRQRIDSSSSSSTNDTVDLEGDTPSIDNSELNIRKVVKIVMSALGQTKENISPKPSRSRKNSTRKSTDSTKSDAKSPKPINNSVEEEGNKCEDNSSMVKSGKRKTQRLRRKTNDQLNRTPEKPKQPRGCRELENLNCTFREYNDMFEKFLLPNKDGKRLCSASGSSTKKPEFCSSNNINENSRKTVQNSDGHDASSSEIIQPAPIGRRRQTCGELQRTSDEPNKTTAPIIISLRRSSENGKFSVENGIVDTESSDETDEFDIEEHRKIKNGLQKTYTKIDKDPFNPVLRVTLQRLSTNEIMKWMKCEKVESQSTVSSIPISVSTPITQNTIDISKSDFGEKPILVPINSKPVNVSKKTTPKAPTHLNNNISMTLNSTKTCVICNKRPYDLTNHYVVQHQTESYTSRLTSEEIENLEANITLAVPHRNRYKVTCAFCQVELEDNFVNFHAHFSYHTGEYGFRCAVCDLVKPYREDIRSHQYRTSTCLNGKIRSNYLYSPDLVVIYLYVCNLCNFVQLNEANIHKHQRDHHGVRFEEPQNVKKCIIAALDNGKILNEIMPADLEEDELTPTIEKDAQSVEQEFLNEHPLDIKDVLLTHQQFPSTSQLAMFENLLQDINIDNEALASVIAPIPGAGIEQVQASPTKPASNIMTVIHTSSDKKCQESHKPYIEPVDAKPELKEIKSAPATDEPQMVQSRMVYRQMPVDSNYFGMYKCTLNDCWFSSNEAYEFFHHISSVHNNAERKIFLDCAYCKYKSTRAHSIVAHVRAKHLMCRFQCAECAYRTTIPGNVAIHRKVYHKNSNSVKHIYECGNRLRQLDEKPTDLMQKMVENIASLKCPDCSKCFYAVSSIKSHIQNTHPLTFTNLDPTSFKELACLHCKEESNNKEAMQMHLALDHPDEIGYVVERKLKNKAFIDAVENLNMINISMPISPAEVHTALIKECDNNNPNIKNTKDEMLFEDAPPSKVMKPIIPEVTIVEDDSITPPIKNVPTATIIEEEKRLRPLLELLTENTGAPASSLYRCPECAASFLHYELWLKHIKTRHNIFNTVSCHYCSKQLSLELAAMHFESHRRHEYICFHCVTSFCSREKICEHFASFHPEFRTTIERKIAYRDVSFSIFKEKDVSLAAVNWLPLFHKLSDALRQQLSAKLQQNQHKVWLAGLSASFLTELEDLEAPKYIINGLPRYKCLIKSCPFVGSDENTLDVHMTGHPAPDKYKCSKCLINENNPTWEKIKNHKMLHKQEIHICCVCKFIHHSLSGMSKHIEELHNIRDVPVVSVWRDEINNKTSLTIVLTERKLSFGTTDTCFCCRKVLKNKLAYHLKKEHKISLCPKCVICDTIILTHLDAEVHAKNNHQSKPFKLKYEVMTPFLYNAIITSISPLTFETRLIKEKRPSHDLAASTSKKVKLNEDIPIKIKQEVVIKTESQEIDNDIPMASIKCVNLENLMQNQTNCTQSSVISVKPISALTVENSQEIQNRSESVGQCQIPNYSLLPNTSGLILPQNVLISTGITVVPYPQNMLFEDQLLNNLRTQNPQLSIIEQPQTTDLNQSCLLIKELGPVCGNCNLECSDFAQLKMHFSTVHALKNERFLFRLNRRVECMYCGFRCSLHSLAAHHETAHPERTRLCRSLIDSSRCGICHEIFISPLSSNSLQLPACACPRRQRLLADCLDLNTLRLIQDFGQNFKYTCEICNMSFNHEQICKQHIVQVHKRAIYPKVTNLEMIFVCYSCEETNTSVGKIIEHIHKVHLCTLRDASIDMISSIYRKIKIIYPKGLTICAGDLKSTRHCHDVENFKQTLQNSELIS